MGMKRGTCSRLVSGVIDQRMVYICILRCIGTRFPYHHLPRNPTPSITIPFDQAKTHHDSSKLQNPDE
jgi:hypothetical protein